MKETIKPLSKCRFKVYDAIFKQRVEVFLNCTQEDFTAYERKMNVANGGTVNFNISAFSTHLSAEGEPNVYIIFLPHFDWTLDDQNSLVHEIVHTIIRIWEANNINFNVETQEFLAQSVGNLYADIGAKILSRLKDEKEIKKRTRKTGR